MGKNSPRPPFVAMANAQEELRDFGFLPMRRYVGLESRYLKPAWSARKIRISTHHGYGDDAYVDVAARVLIDRPMTRHEVVALAHTAGLVFCDAHMSEAARSRLESVRGICVRAVAEALEVANVGV